MFRSRPVLIVMRIAPPTRVLRDSEIPSSRQTTLLEAAALEPEERIQLVYSTGFFSILEDGNLLTQERAPSPAWLSSPGARKKANRAARGRSV